MQRKICVGILAFLAIFVVLPLSAQDTPNPTCAHCSATYVPQSEVDSYIQRSIANNIADQQMRAVDIGKAHVGIGVVHRGKLVPRPGGGGQPVGEHEQVSEIYHIIDGSGTLMTGPDLVNPKKLPDTAQTVREENGPGYGATTVANPEAHELKAGDVVVIPAGTGHWFTKIDDHITYLVIRIDPDKVLPLKSEEQSKAHLAKPYAAGQGNF